MMRKKMFTGLVWMSVLALALFTAVPRSQASPNSQPAESQGQQPDLHQSARSLNESLLFSPIDIGRYCKAQIDFRSHLGFYEATGLKCYASGGPTPETYLGQGDPLAACRYLVLPPKIVVSVTRTDNNLIICEVALPPTPTPTPIPTTLSFGPLDMGRYCKAMVDFRASIGFAEPTGVNCYATTGGPLTYLERADLRAACIWLVPPPKMVLNAESNPSNKFLVCTIR